MKGNELAYIVIALLFSPLLIEVFKIIKFLRRKQIDRKKLFNHIRKAVFVLVALLIFLFSLNWINFLNYKKPIAYSQISTITLENFVGFEFFRLRLNGSKKFAYIVTSIDSERIDNGVKIQALFHPSRSYVYNKYAKSKELLKHELYHFRITELFARKIRQSIASSASLDNDELDSIISRYKGEERDFQIQYDFDTYHSYILREQKKYERKIDSLINSLEEYSQEETYFHAIN